MSSDPTRPLPPPEWNPDAPTQQYPGGGQRPQPPRPPGQPRPTFTPNDQSQRQQPYQPPQQPYQPPPQPHQQQQQYQPQQGYDQQQQQYGSPQQQYQPPQYDQQYQDDQQYMGAPPDRVRRPRRRRRRWPIVLGVIVILLLVLAVAADRFACYEAENQMADQIQQNGLPVKPHVSIEGFPFLTQLAAKDFNDVVISASNITEDGLTIASINATLHGMHLIDGYSGARIDTLDGSALITFKALANAGSFPSGVTLGPGSNPSQIKATVSVPVLGSVSATVQVTKTSANKFTVKVVDAGGIESSLLGNLANYTYTVPQLPAGMDIQGVTVTQQGVLITITGKNTTLTQSSS